MKRIPRALRRSVSALLPLLSGAACCSLASAQDASRFSKEVIVPACEDPLQIDLSSDGRLFFIERKGAVKMWAPGTGRVTRIGDFPAAVTGDAGALGLTLARDFDQSGHIFTLRVPATGPARMVLARFTLKGEELEDEKQVLTIPLGSGREQSHCGGGLAWDTRGNLLIGIGDNMPPQDVPAIHAEDITHDARGTAGNSQDLRGKILRITPRDDGSYSIPEGNLFTDSAKGRPEVFAFGVRNPFRVTCDTATGLVIWGDVGNNVRLDLDLGPEGFDEINATREPGFFGWPFCCGPNTPWRPFDPRTQKPAGDYFRPEKLINDSRANTGLRELPPARPAVFYYNNTVSPDWPFTGSGGRSITGGVVYHKPAAAGESRLPDEWEGAYLFGEWMRNWVAAARFDASGKLLKAERVLTDLAFKRPADFRIGPDGALYIAECGDRWTGNTESRITRITYQRGNRAPRAAIAVSRTAGKLPLEVTFESTGTADPDGDALIYTWNFGDGGQASGATVRHTFNTSGVFPATLTVTDAAGAAATASLTIAAGNEAPRVEFTSPADGGFIDGKEIAWALAAQDAEDGAIPPERVLVQMEKRDRAAADDTHPGLALMRQTTCFACHSATQPSAGPPYAAVAAKYAADPAARSMLTAKVINGGTGVWGQLPMPPHPQHTPAQAAQMVDWVLSLAQRKITALPSAAAGQAAVPASPGGWGRADNTVILLSASTTDNGAGTLPPQRGTAEVLLRARRQRAACFDHSAKAAAQDNLDQGGLVARIQPGGWIGFDRIRLQEFRQVKLSGWPQGSAPLTARIMAGDKELAAQNLQPGPAASRKPAEFVLTVPDPAPDAAPAQIRIALDGPPGSVLDLMWVEFQKP